jgi:PAS domain S-box-containing protein
MGAFSQPEDIGPPSLVEGTLRRVIDTIPCLVTRSRPDGYVDFVNQRWLEFTGFKLEDVLGWGWRAAVHPEDVERHLRRRRAAVIDGKPFVDEIRVRRSDAEYCWFLNREAPLRDERGNIVNWYGTCYDIEDLKETAEKLRQSETELRQILDAIPAHVFVLEPDASNFLAGRYLPNRQSLEYTGLTLQEVSADPMQIFLREDAEKLRALRQASLVKGMPFEAEARVRRRDGQYRWFLIRVNPLRDDTGRIMRWYGTRTDIDEQKRAEDHLRLAIDTIPQQIWSGPADGSVDFCNAQWLSYTGLTAEEVLGEGWQRILHPDDRERVLKARRELVALGGTYEMEVRRRGALGEYRWFLTRAVPLKDSEGRIVRWYGTNTDIEDRKQAEDYLRLVIDTIPQQIWSGQGEGSPDFLLDFCNAQWRSYTGLTLEDLQGDGWQRILHPDDRERVLKAWRESKEMGKPYEQELRRRGADGKYRWFLGRGVPLKDAAGRIVRWYGTNTDIEDRKEAESRLRLVVDTTPALLYSARPDGELDFFNQRWLDYLGLSFDDILGWGWTSAIHPEDMDALVAKWRSALATGEPYETEARVRRADGQYRWMLLRKVPLRDQAGNIVEWYGSGVDIEDRRRAENAVRQSEDRLQLMVDTTPAMLHSARPDGYLDFFNKRWLEYVGLTLEDMSGWGWTSVIHPDDVEGELRKWRSALATGEPFQDEVRVRRADGEYRWMLHNKVAARDEEGNVNQWYGSAVDIEEQYQARAALQKAFNEITALRDQLYKENLVLKEEIVRSSMFVEMIGSSTTLQNVLVHVERVAPTDSTVLITGETGTGKELVARAIHKRSNRAAQSFVSVNCAAIPASLVASELFGYEKGAFTGAVGQHLGRFELADGGTIFLDEIGDLPPPTQIALLRVLQERTFERVGGAQSIRVNVRVLAATNRDLQAAVEAGTFRQDLFYRLNVFPIHIPPLRDRVEDIPLLVDYFVQRYATKAGKKIRSIKRKTLELLQCYDWPGNIRELQNVMERAVILCDGDLLAVDKTWLQHESARPSVAQGLRRLDEKQEREIIESALRQTQGRVFGLGGAAAKLGIPRSTLESRIRSLKIDKQRFKPK